MASTRPTCEGAATTPLGFDGQLTNGDTGLVYLRAAHIGVAHDGPAGPPKVVSERLGHGSAAFTLDVYSHAAAPLDEHAAESVAAAIAGRGASAR